MSCAVLAVQFARPRARLGESVLGRLSEKLRRPMEPDAHSPGVGKGLKLDDEPEVRLIIIQNDFVYELCIIMC